MTKMEQKRLRMRMEQIERVLEAVAEMRRECSIRRVPEGSSLVYEENDDSITTSES